jgi:hypothetical protein
MRWVAAVSMTLLCSGLIGHGSKAAAQTYGLLLSSSPDRSSPSTLQGASVSGSIYVFTSPTSGVNRVQFFLDDPTMARAPRQTENAAPYDFAGTAASSLANAFGTLAIANGTHTITAVVELSAGGTQVLNAAFTVSNTNTSTHQLLVSAAPDRTNPVALTGYSASGNIYVFTSPTTGVSRVRFFLDDPQMTGAPRQTENNPPHDFSGTASSGLANPFNTAGIADGSHVITAAFELVNGGTEVVSATFTVANTAPALVWSPDPVRISVAPGGSTTTQVNLNSTSGTAAFTLTESAPWLTVNPTAGSTPASVSLGVDAAGLGAGVHTTSVQASAAGYASDTLSVILTVGNPQPPDQVHLAWTTDPATSLVVVWRTLEASTPSVVEYRRLGQTAWQSASGAQRASGTTGSLHEVALSGLTPSTSYEYRARGDYGAWSPAFTTRTAPPRGPADFDAVYVADTGLIGRLDGLATGTQQVINEIAALNPLVVLLGGDYAYFNTDTRFGSLENTIDAWFNQMQPIGTRSPMMPTYGNHEVLLGEGYAPWAARFPTPPGFDGRRHYSFDIGDVHFVSIMAVAETTGLSSATLQWIEQDITAARNAGQRWIVPFFHVSPFSDGANHRSNLALRAQLGPLFERLGVKIAIASHDQSYERTYPLVDVPTTNTPTSLATACYTMADGVTWVKVSPGGKLSNQNGDFSRFLTQPPPAWTAVRDNTVHHFARLSVRASGAIHVETYGVVGDGTPPILQDRFQYTVGSCPPELAFSKQSIVLTAPVGGHAEAEVDVDMRGGTSQAFSLTDGAPWLTVNPISATTPARVRVSADATGLSTGVHETTVVAQGAGAISDTLGVSFSVGDPYTLLVSSRADRATAQPLQGTTVSGNIYVFSNPGTNVTRVQFFLDDPGMTRPPRQIERTAPHDFAGGAVDLANPFNVSQLSSGTHTITAAIELATGGVQVVNATFVVSGAQ